MNAETTDNSDYSNLFSHRARLEPEIELVTLVLSGLYLPTLDTLEALAVRGGSSHGSHDLVVSSR